MMLLTQATIYAIPAWLFGIVFAQGAAVAIKAKVATLLGVEDVSPLLTWDGILLGCFLGLVAPVVASILPIRSALGKNLQSSLDTRQSKTKAVEVKLTRDDPTQNISWNSVYVGIVLSLFGGSIYYGLPLGLLSMNLGLLLNIFFGILISMLLGLVFLSLNLQRGLEIILIQVFFFWENKAIRSVLNKNLIAHRTRNQKTTIMYALSLGFIIFISIAATVQIDTIQYAKLQSRGVYMAVHTNGGHTSFRTIAPLLEEFARTSPYIKRWGWVSEELGGVLPSVERISSTHTGNLFTRSGVRLFGVSPNYFDITLQEFLKVGESGVPEGEILKALYQISDSALVPSLYKSKLGLKLNDVILLRLEVRRSQPRRNQMEATAVDKDTFEISKKLRVIGFLDAAPGFLYSPFPLVQHQTILVSFPTYLKLSQDIFPNASSIPYGRFILDMDPGLSKLKREDLKNSLVSLTRGSGSVWDYQQDVEPLIIPTTILSYIFNLTTLVAMSICFFSLMSSMFTNVYEQTKEIAVLRSLGFEVSVMYRVYIYEAFILVFASSLLGVGIGLFVGYAMTIQQSLFTQLPVPFKFPWEILLMVFGCSVLFAFLASWVPIHHVLSLQIVQIFRFLS
eukprot:TRINITY_DN6974_c0_g1_i18.p1 TRINITY_DN6974_c0_g1~~TRINITY_DN6974_c0_g1_i18.p1  ORF type:complete len:621 (-),score=103.89 TRINITY_DN6974_c0_g1_i18:126-1988(-)